MLIEVKVLPMSEHGYKIYKEKISVSKRFIWLKIILGLEIGLQRELY